MKTWSLIISKAKENIQSILIVVINNYGSSPGRKGFKMLVSEDGQIAGSVGGGSMEQNMIRQAREMISENNEQIIIIQQDHHSAVDKDNSGMICSGSQAIAFFPMSAAMLREAESIFNYESNKGVGLIKYSPSGFILEREKRQEERFISTMVLDDDWELSEQVGMPDKLYIFGAGHVSLALSRVCEILDFEIELFDNRSGLMTFDTNSYVSRKEIIDFENVGHLVQEGNNSYVVIMSYSHEYDESLLGQLLNKKVRYLGMMGSKAKVKKIKTNLLAQGYTEEQLSMVHAPIGIPINSQTPEEIAISIIAQIISVRNESLSH
ncbi:MAG: XdhC family protein [Bacteroidales bacterium]|nr:XdhC family protein [Bacteroidales bacterium]